MNTSKMCVFCIMHTVLSINRKNTCFCVQNHPFGTEGAKIAMFTGSPIVHDNVVGKYSSCLV